MSNVEVCPLCGKSRARFRRLYGHLVCRACAYRFALLRSLAVFIDFALIRLASGWLHRLLFVLAVSMITSGNFDVVYAVLQGATGLLLYGPLTLKDGFSGYSPGRSLLGLRVIDADTGAPIGFGKSLKRNLPLLLPLVGPIVIAVQLTKGNRWGDGWARTKVIWLRYKDNPVFLAANVSPPDSGFGPARIELPTMEASDNPYKAPRA